MRMMWSLNLLWFFWVVYLLLLVSSVSSSLSPWHRKSRSTTNTRNLQGTSSEDEADLLSLPLGDVNLLVLTDVHSWVAGHNKDLEPFLNVDYGDVLSFYETLRYMANNRGKELFLIDNGDFMDGTGLGLQLDRLFSILERMPFSVLNLGNHELYFDDNLIAMRDLGFLDHWRQGNRGRFLSSNTVWTDTGRPIGHRFTYLTTSAQSQHDDIGDDNNNNSPKTILVFGFLYNMDDACASATVERVEDVVKQKWFQNVLLVNNNKDNNRFFDHGRPHDNNTTTTTTNGTLFETDVFFEPFETDVSFEPYQAIIVLAHMDHRHPLIEVIRSAIRNITGNRDIPIQFVAGHSHVRGYSVLDDMATSFEAGRFLDTIGFAAFPWKRNSTKNTIDCGGGYASDQDGEDEEYYNSNVERDDYNNDDFTNYVSTPDDGISWFPANNMGKEKQKFTKRVADPGFHHVYLDANKKALQDVLNGNRTALDTGRGRALTHFIQGTRFSMGLNTVIGCSGGHYRLNFPMTHPRSLWGLYCREVIPHALENNHSRIFIQRTTALRYDLLIGKITVDDAVAVSPMPDEMVRILPEVDRETLLLLFDQLNATAPDSKYKNLPRYAVSPWPDSFHHRHIQLFELYTMRRDWPAIQEALMELAADGSLPPFVLAAWNNGSIVPTIYKKDGSNIQTTNGVWIDFIQDSWKCVGPVSTGLYRLKEWLVWILILVALVGLAHYHSWINNNSNNSYRPTTYMRMAGVTAQRQHILQNARHFPNHYQTYSKTAGAASIMPTETSPFLSLNGGSRSSRGGYVPRPYTYYQPSKE